MKYFSTGLIVLLVAVVASVVGGVWVCAYFYKEGKRKSQVRPMDQPAARMVEPFSTKKLWERGRNKPAVTLTESESVKSISINGVIAIAKGPSSENNVSNDEAIMIENESAGGINPCSGETPSPMPTAPQQESSTNANTSGATAVDVS